MKNHLKVSLCVSIFLALAFGSSAQDFITACTPVVGPAPASITSADVNGTGQLDLISANFSGNSLSVLTNSGSGQFVVSTTLQLATGSGPAFVTAADFNGDGKVDLACADFFVGTITIFTNDGAGGFVTSATIPTGPANSGPICVTAADLRGTGEQDLIVADFGTSGSGNTLLILTNNGSGGFSFYTNLVAGSGVTFVIAADLNGDGSPDLVTANENDGTLTVFTNNGSGFFQPSATLGVGAYPLCVATADVDGDGRPDLISADNGSSTLTIWTNQGAGIFGLKSAVPVDPGSGPAYVLAVDLNGDHRPDLISAGYNLDILSVLLNTGGGNFTEVATPAVGVNPNELVAGDFIGGGLPDVACANFGDTTLSVLLNTPATVVQPGATNVVVSWTSGATNWVVQENADLTTTNWVNYGGDVGDDGTNHTASFGVLPGSDFFRLVHP